MDLVEELKNKQYVDRSDIARLLSSIGVPGDKREEKIEAVKKLGLSNIQQIGLETQLNDYSEY